MSGSLREDGAVDVGDECVFCIIDREVNDAVRKTQTTLAMHVQSHALFVLGWTTGLGDLHAPMLCVGHARAQYDSVDLLCDALGGDADERTALRLLLGFSKRPEGEPDEPYVREVSPSVVRGVARDAMSAGLRSATRAKARPRR
jgi:hypothetical protein